MLKCAHCGKPGHAFDLAFGLPDAIHELAPLARSRRAFVSSDICVLDGTRHFIRGVLYLPVLETDRRFGIGFWVEVPKATCEWYAAHYEEDLTGAPSAEGTLANALPRPGYAPTLGLAVRILWGARSERPRFVVDDVHQLTVEQIDGITEARAHELLDLPN